MIPSWSYPIAFVAAFVAARLAKGAGGDAAAAAPSPATPAAASATDDYGAYGDGSFGYGDPGSGIGGIPYPVGTGPGDVGAPPPILPPGTLPPPAPKPPPPTPPPPTPAPTTITVYRPGTRPDSTAGGWAYFRASQPVYDPVVVPWNGRYPVHVKNARQLGAGHQGTRWVSVAVTAVLPSGQQILVRRITGVGTNTWIGVWVPASGYAVYGASVPSIRIVP